MAMGIIILIGLITLLSSEWKYNKYEKPKAYRDVWGKDLK